LSTRLSTLAEYRPNQSYIAGNLLGQDQVPERYQSVLKFRADSCNSN